MRRVHGQEEGEGQKAFSPSKVCYTTVRLVKLVKGESGESCKEVWSCVDRDG